MQSRTKSMANPESDNLMKRWGTEGQLHSKTGDSKKNAADFKCGYIKFHSGNKLSRNSNRFNIEDNPYNCDSMKSKLR